MSEFQSVPLPFQRTRSSVDSAPQPVGEVSLTQAEFLDQCDINHQIALYTRSGQPLPPWPAAVDPDAVQDLTATYVDAVNAVNAVEDAFGALPAAVRTKFQNDPLQFAQFLADPANRDEAISLGLVNKPPADPQSPAKPLRGGADADPPSPPQEGE